MCYILPQLLSLPTRPRAYLPDEIEYLAPKQVAVLLGVTISWLCKRRRGKYSDGPRWHRRGGKPLYTRADIDQYITENTKGP